MFLVRLEPFDSISSVWEVAGTVGKCEEDKEKEGDEYFLIASTTVYRHAGARRP
jgi:hypothetical protein